MGKSDDNKPTGNWYFSHFEREFQSGLIEGYRNITLYTAPVAQEAEQPQGGEE